jgi:hypothetical protein
VFGFLRNWSQLSNVPAELREQLEAEGLIFLAHKVGVSQHGLVIDIGLHAVDRACSGMMKLNYKRKIPDEVLQKLPTTTVRFPVEPVSIYRAAGVRPKP